MLAARRRSGRALPDQQRRARQRAVPAAAATSPRGVRVALGTDVGAGTGFSLFKEGLQAYFVQQLLGADGVPLTGAHLLYLATAAGADALGLRDQVGDLERRQAVRRAVAASARRLRPSTSGCATRTVRRTRWRKAFALATAPTWPRVWVDGAAGQEPANRGDLSILLTVIAARFRQVTSAIRN